MDMKKTDESANDLKPATYIIGRDGKKHPKSQVTSAVQTMRKAVGLDKEEVEKKN